MTWRRSRTRHLLCTAAVALLGGLTVAALPAFTAVRPQQAAAATAPGALAQEFPNGPGKKTFLQICSSCHSPDNVIGHGQGEDGWGATLNDMIQQGAQGSDQNFEDILGYLAQNFPPAPAKVKINQARAIDLQSWLAVPQAQAEAIVRYRRAHGAFRSVLQLERTPGVSRQLIESFQDRLSFVR